jgi:hypothetical protein
MLIDRYQSGWDLELVKWRATLPKDINLFLLVDGAFVPGLFRQLGGVCKPVLLFESLPGCTEETRDVSPFLLPFSADEQSLARVLANCDGQPMLSAIATSENIERLGQRLAAWCVVEVDGQCFNLRFPDTRRLPAIVDVMTSAQRYAFVGDACSWHFIGRDGAWHAMPLHVDPGSPVERAVLNEGQFTQLVEDSEPDEIWSRLQYRGVDWHSLPSRRHHLLSRSIALAREHGLDDTLTLRWCSQCMSDENCNHVEDMHLSFAQWKRDNADARDEVLSDMA